MAKCKGIIGKMLGHKWVYKVVPADRFGPGIFYTHGQGPYTIITVCSRCGVKHI